MTEIEWPDHHHVNATIGWLMLGDVVEARAEVEKLTARSRQQPQVLGVEWRLLSHEQRWAEAVTAAESQLAATPDDPEPWIHRSFALHELGRTREALDLLQPAAECFPKETTVPYNLACYTCQLGDLPGALQWFARALALGESPVEKVLRLRAALQDADLQPLWPEFRQLVETLQADPGA